MWISGRKAFAIIWIIFVSYEAMSCVDNTAKDGDGGNNMPSKSIDTVLQEHTEKIMAIPGVVGMGEGLCSNDPCIKVFVKKKTAELQKKIPRELEGYVVELEETGEVRALPKN